MGTEREPIAARLAAAAARTVAAGTARLFAAWPMGSPVPETADRRCDGVADLAARRARVAQAMFFTDEATAAFTGQAGAGQAGAAAPVEQTEMVYDGASCYVHAAGLARRIAVNTDSDTRPPGESVWSLVELWDFGVPVEISPPRADELLAPAEAFRGAYDRG